MTGDGEPPEIGAEGQGSNRSDELRTRRNELKEKIGANLDNTGKLINTVIHLLPQGEGERTPLNDLLSQTRESAEGATDIAWTIALQDSGLSPKQILSLWDRKTSVMDFETQIDDSEEQQGQ